MPNIPEIHVQIADHWKDYELLDSGDGEKLERFGKYTFSRPEAQAVWQPALPPSTWEKADALFETTGEENGGHWKFRKPLPDNWKMQYGPISFLAMAGSSRHLGVFPEQATQWDWVMEKIRAAGKPVKVLNLFGYTGLASLAAASAGAEVTHVDASKKVIAWARENQAISGLSEKPIRWIVDDALKFVEREARRNSLYDGIILDPPKFGRGPKGEVWEFFKLFPQLLAACGAALNKKPLFMVVTAYAVKSSALTLHGAMNELMASQKGSLEVGEIASMESSAGRIVSNALYARWQS